MVACFTTGWDGAPYAKTCPNSWRFPKIGVPRNIIDFRRTFHSKPSVLGYLRLWKPRCQQIKQMSRVSWRIWKSVKAILWMVHFSSNYPHLDEIIRSVRALATGSTRTRSAQLVVLTEPHTIHSESFRFQQQIIYCIIANL